MSRELRRLVLLTELDAQDHDARRDAEASIHARERWLERFHLSIDMFRERRSARSDLSDRDIIWSMFNEDLQKLMVASDFHGLKVRYYEMALFVAEEDRSFIELLEQHSRMELLGYRETGLITHVQVSTAGLGSACEACYRQDGKIFSIDVALRSAPLPCKQCTMIVVGNKPGFCRCLYVPVIP